MFRSIAALCAALFVTTTAGEALGQASAADRQVQFRSVDFDSAIVELHNFGASDVDITAWRWCRADEAVSLRYTTLPAAVPVIVQAGTSVFIYYNNDAPGGGDADNINLDEWPPPLLGTPPIDSGPYGLAIYIATGLFATGTNMVDYVQWSIGGIDDLSADARAFTAQQGGLWADQNDWVSTSGGQTGIELGAGQAANVVDDSTSYGALVAPVPLLGFVAALGLVGLLGVTALRRAR